MKTKCLRYFIYAVFILAFFTNSNNIHANIDHGNHSSSKEVDLSKLTGRVVTVNDPEYNVARLSWNLYFSRFPLAIVYPQNKCDVQNAVNFCRDNEITFRIRAGGHSYEGWNSIDGGIIIDLTDMTNIRADVKKRLAYVEAGVRSLQAVLALGELGFGLPNGLEKHPGIAGVVLGGGGIGLSIRQFGLTADYLVEVEIVLASGEIVRATKTNEYSDLLYACQGGGGGNIGIVTEFVFSIFPRGDVTLYEIHYPYETLETLIDTWQNWAPFQIKRLESIMELFVAKDHKVYGVFDGSKKELLKLLAPMLAIPGSELFALKTVPYFQSWLFFAAEPTPPVNDKISSTFAYKLLPPKAIRTIKKALDNPVNADAEFFFLALGGVMKKTPKTATPFWNRDAQFYFEWDQSWPSDQPEQAGPSFTWVENLRSALRPFTKGSYVNVPDLNITNWAKAYYGKNFKKLRTIKTKYDPHNLFTYEIQAIPPKN